MTGAVTAAGATPEQWSLLMRLGLTEDLLPVVSAPGIVIHERSKLKDLGKTPSKISSDGYAVGIPKWTQQVTTERQVGGWSKDGRLGICIQTRVARAIDIDIGDPAKAKAVRLAIEQLAGWMPVRWRENSGKCLLAFSMPADGITKRILRTEHGIIEFLAQGQQFIAFGRHHTGVHYQWDGLDQVDIAGGFPEMSVAQFEELWQDLCDIFGDGDDASHTARRGVAPSVARSKLDMHGDPVVAFLDENGWVTEYDRDGRVHVRCPWEAEHTSDSGPSSTTYFPAGVGGFALGHWRCLHAHCQGRGDAEWMAEIGYEVDQFEDMTQVDILADGSVVPRADAPKVDWGPLPTLTKTVVKRKSKVEPTMDNAIKAVGHPGVCGFQLAYDAFRDETMVAPADGGRWSPLRDSTYAHLRVNLERHGFMAVGKELVRDAALAVAERNEIDSAVQWVQGLRWDGVERVEMFMSTHLGVEDSPYTRAVARYMWTAMAGRALVPGVKADMVPVLLGGQGIKKTTLVESLSPLPETFVEIDLSSRDADLARSLRGKLVGEIAELRGLTTRDSESIKAWITRRHEEWVPKWRETTTRFWRRLLLVGTGNKHEFLDDETGERRWLPVDMAGMVDTDAVVRDRDQLWAEGAEMFMGGGVDWQDAQALAVEVHKNHKVHDEWEGSIARWLLRDTMDQVGDWVRAHGTWSMAEIAAGALGIDTKNLGKREEMRIGKVLRGLGMDRRVVREGRATPKKWVLADGGAALGLNVVET